MSNKKIKSAVKERESNQEDVQLAQDDVANMYIYNRGRIRKERENIGCANRPCAMLINPEFSFFFTLSLLSLLFFFLYREGILSIQHCLMATLFDFFID